MVDASPAGLFVQTRAKPTPNTVVELIFRAQDPDPEIHTEAGVARQREVPSHLRPVVPNAIGLELLDPPRALLDLLARTLGRESTPSPRAPIGGRALESGVLNALWENLEDQVKDGVEPPAGVQMDVVNGVVQRDEFGNGLGGVRLPSMDVPIATYTPGNQADPNLPPFLQAIGNLACFLASSVTPFDQETLDELYPNHGGYVSQVVLAANQLRDDGLLLNADRATIATTAAKSGIGCGIGFELVFLLPPLMWLHRRRRQHDPLC